MAYVVVARWTARAGNEEGVGQALGKLTAPSRAEPGCRAYQPLQSLEDPREFLIYEEYDDEAAYDAHASSEHFQRYALEEGIPLLESRGRSYYATLDG
jgi:quinol monooxygenase YgiN